MDKYRWSLTVYIGTAVPLYPPIVLSHRGASFSCRWGLPWCTLPSPFLTLSFFLYLSPPLLPPSAPPPLAGAPASLCEPYTSPVPLTPSPPDSCRWGVGGGEHYKVFYPHRERAGDGCCCCYKFVFWTFVVVIVVAFVARALDPDPHSFPLKKNKRKMHWNC